MTCTAMLTFDAALAILRAAAEPLGTEPVPLGKAGRRVLAEPIVARIDLPRCDTAAMDGYAVAGPLTGTGARVIGAVYPGRAGIAALASGQAVRIMTGAPIPAGADRVIPLEVAQEVDGVVRPAGAAPSRNHVRSRGSDMTAGREVLATGTVLDPRALVTAAAADVAQLVCWRRPTVSVIASGDELAPPGHALPRTDAIPDSLSQALLLIARQWGAKPLDAVLVPDDADAIRAAAEAALAQGDVLVLAGGASRGDRDFARSALASLGLQIRFAGVAMKPGKPAWYGRIGDRHVLGLPGNPTAAMTVARLFLAPLLRSLAGGDFDSALRWRHFPLVGVAVEPSLRERFLCARQVGEGMHIIEKQSASEQAMLAQAQWLVRLGSNLRLAPGSPIASISF
jgi:molybdopterin molybdotransferase